jgi:hypothetical protein
MIHGSIHEYFDDGKVEYLGFENSNPKDKLVDLEDNTRVVSPCSCVMQHLGFSKPSKTMMLVW